MEDFKKFDLNEKTETTASDSTEQPTFRPLAPEDVPPLPEKLSTGKMVGDPTTYDGKGWCVSCEQDKVVYKICLECAVKLGRDNPVEENDVSKRPTAEEIWDQLVYTQHLESGDEAYVIEKVDFIKAMQEFSQAQRLQARNEAIPLIEKCEKTFGKIHEIFELLKNNTDHEALVKLIEAIDIDIPQIQAIIKDELSKLKTP